MSDNEAPMSGGIPFAIGVGAIVRIPIPGSGGLCIEFSPRGWVPPSGSTSRLFFQDLTGKRHLRLDYGYNPSTKTVNYHWNQAGTHGTFGISDHAAAGRAGQLAFRAAKYFRGAGQVLLVVGVAIDVVSIAKASKPLRRSTEVVAGWAAAWVACEAGGAGGAWLGTPGGPIGIAAGGLIGCVVVGGVAYSGASRLGGTVYDWAEDTVFTRLPEMARP